MRLLNTTTKKLESFYDEHVPPYAILSHTWGDQEVLFRHIVGSDDARCEGERRKGYVKVMGACEQALKDGWEYIWIDTCCIDKESSAELSEAINSMYRWYRQAQVCYVYLEDVYSSAHDESSPAGDTDGNEDGSPVETVPFGHSRWFTRGWTLQELLAPQFIVFYSKNWVDIGTRASLQDVISATTGIRVEMLVAYDPKKASIAERMSWAACRMTRRKEDIAYCLMGLFGVNMPLLYGEGNRAFRRLQEEIMKVSDDHSLFAWKGCYSSYIIPNDANLLTTENHKAQGMLADSPWDFRDGVDIVPSEDGAFSPYSMTNQGLQIQLPLQPIDSEPDLLDIDSDYRENIFKTTLKCTIRDKQPTRWIVVYLKMIRKGYYERVFAHLLHETETDPNESELTLLVVPQVDTSATYNCDTSTYQRVDMKTLPTESGFTTNGHSLVEGYKHLDYEYIYMALEFISVALFDGPEGECFAVVIGFEDGLFWLDVHRVNKYWSRPQKRRVLESSIKQAYREGGSLYNRVLWHLDRRTAGNSDYSIVVSAKKFNNKGYLPSLRITVDIQRIPFLTRVWSPTPSPTSTSDSFYRCYVAHPDFKEEHGDWITISNPKVKRFSVSPVHSIMCRRSPGTPYYDLVIRVQFSPDGKYLAVAWSNPVVRVYDTNTGKPCVLFGDTIDDPRLGCVCFSPDGKFLATGDSNGRIVFWDIAKGRIHKVFSDRQYGVSSLCFSPDGRLIASGSENGIIQIWDIANETSPISTIDSPNSKFLYSVAISYNGRLIAGNCNDIAWIWDIATTRLVKQFKETYSSVVFTPDGKELVVGGDYGLGYLDVSELVPTTQAIGNMEGSSDEVGPGHDPSALGMPFQGNTNQRTISKFPVKSVAVSRDGHSAISGLPNGSVEFWDLNLNLKSATFQFMLQGHIGMISSVDISPVGNIFATGGYDGRVRIWRYHDTT